MSELTRKFHPIPPDMREGRTALVVIDMNDEYLVEGFASTNPSNNYRKAHAAIRFVSEKFREHQPDILQIWVGDGSMGSAEELYAFNRDDVLKRYTGFDQKPEDAVFLKLKNDAFDDDKVWNVETGESLVAYLQDKGIQNIFICGGRITRCIEASSKGAIKKGFNAIPVEDAITGCDEGWNRGDALHLLTEAGIHLYSLQYSILPYYKIDPEPLTQELQEIQESLPKPPQAPSCIKRIVRRLFPE